MIAGVHQLHQHKTDDIQKMSRIDFFFFSNSMDSNKCNTLTDANKKEQKRTQKNTKEHKRTGKNRKNELNRTVC